MTILKFTRRTLSRYADDKAVEGFAKVCEQQGVVTRTDEIAAYLARPNDKQDIAALAKLLGQSE